VTYSLDAFKGRTVLLEFWATWCPYCVAELPAVHQAWDRFKGRNFEILSFSLDRKAEDVAPFRKAKLPMPWKHAFLPGAKLHPIAEAYGAAGIPKYVLIGPDGVILAAGQSLRGKNLEGTLAKYLGN
jgi:thiol-disulfide isomerase/thioredoxin